MCCVSVCQKEVPPHSHNVDLTDLQADVKTKWKPSPFFAQSKISYGVSLSDRRTVLTSALLTMVQAASKQGLPTRWEGTAQASQRDHHLFQVRPVVPLTNYCKHKQIG